MKKLTMVLILTAIAAFAFGEGNQENGAAPLQAGEKVTLNGTLSWEDGHPELKTADGTYALAAPGAYWYRDTFKEGSEISVEGTLFEPGPRAYDPDEAHVAVEKVTLDGKTYDIDSMAAAGRPGPAWGGSAPAGRGMAGRNGGFGRGSASGMRNGAGMRGPVRGPRF